MADNLDTIGGRISHLLAARKIKSSGELARLVNAAGYEVSRQAVHALVTGGVEKPRMGLVETIASVLDTTPEYILYGPRQGEDTFVLALEGLKDDLEPRQRDQILWLAKDMAQETRRRREEEAKRSENGLTKNEAELLRLFRAASPAERSLLFRVAGAESAPEED